MPIYILLNHTNYETTRLLTTENVLGPSPEKEMKSLNENVYLLPLIFHNLNSMIESKQYLSVVTWIRMSSTARENKRWLKAIGLFAYITHLYSHKEEIATDKVTQLQGVFRIPFLLYAFCILFAFNSILVAAVFTWLDGSVLHSWRVRIELLALSTAFNHRLWF